VVDPELPTQRIQKLRAKYSLGVIVILAAAAPKKLDSAALASVMRP
jgi:hypothetical protein